MGAPGRAAAGRDGIPFRASPAKPLLIVDAWVDGQGPFEFVIDTGASVTVISPRLAKRIGLRQAGVRRGTAVAAAGTLDVQLASIGSLRVGPVTVTDVEVAVMSLRAVRKAIGARLEGIIGYNVLSRYRVTIDYPNGYLRLTAGRGPADPEVSR